MPLIKSSSKEALGKNIKAERSAGKPRAQAIAIALDVARRAGAKIPKKQDGGPIGSIRGNLKLPIRRDVDVNIGFGGMPTRPPGNIRDLPKSGIFEGRVGITKKFAVGGVAAIGQAAAPRYRTMHNYLKGQESRMEERQLDDWPGEDTRHYYHMNPGEDTNPYTRHQRERSLALGGSARQPKVPEVPKTQFQSFTGGLIQSNVPGRTDKINMNVPAGSYVVPSSVVSHLGQDNTMAGASVLDNIFKRASSKNTGMSAKIRTGRAYRLKRKADGGSVNDVPIIAAGGEWVATPDMLIDKFGDLDRAHKIMDRFVVDVRKKHIQTLKKLPGPIKS